MLKIGKNGLSLVAGLLLVGGFVDCKKSSKNLHFLKKGGRMLGVLVFFYKVCQCFVSKCAKM